MNIVLVGHVCIDHNTTEKATYTSWGSSVLYITRYLKEKHRLQPLIITSYGPDMLEHLPPVKLDPKKPNQPKTLIYENDTRTEPRIRRAFNVENATPPALTETAIRALQSADMVVVAALLPNYMPDYLRSLMRHVKPNALKLLSAQGYFHTADKNGLIHERDFTEAPEIFPLFNLVVYSADDHPQALRLAKQWAKLAPNTNIIVTQGPKGATIMKGVASTSIPTKPIPEDEIIDSVGCGDVFVATVAYYYRQSGHLPQAVQVAHKTAAQKLRGTPLSQT